MGFYLNSMSISVLTANTRLASMKAQKFFLYRKESLKRWRDSSTSIWRTAQQPTRILKLMKASNPQDELHGVSTVTRSVCKSGNSKVNIINLMCHVYIVWIFRRSFYNFLAFLQNTQRPNGSWWKRLRMSMCRNDERKLHFLKSKLFI